MRAVATALMLLAVSATLSGQFVPQEGVSVGVVRGDGFLFGVATWSGGAWRPLTVSEPKTDRLALTTGGRQLPRDGWRLIRLADGVVRPLVLAEVITTRSHCVMVEGFVTDAPQERMPDSSPKPKIGVAIVGDAPLERPEDVVPQPDAASRRAAALVVRMVQTLEADTIRGERGARLRALDPSVRAAGTVRLAQFRRAAASDESQYFFEARKTYRGVRDHVFVSGWLSQARGGDLRIQTLRSWVAGRDGETTLVTSTVHGVIRLAPYRLVWLMEDHGYEGERYSLVDLAEGGRVLSVSGGGC